MDSVYRIVLPVSVRDLLATLSWLVDFGISVAIERRTGWSPLPSTELVAGAASAHPIIIISLSLSLATPIRTTVALPLYRLP